MPGRRRAAALRDRRRRPRAARADRLRGRAARAPGGAGARRCRRRWCSSTADAPSASRSRARPTRCPDRGGVRVALAPTPRRRPRRRARARCARYPYTLPRAARVARRRARRRGALARGRRGAAVVPDGNGLLKYFPTMRRGQRGAHRLRAVDRDAPPGSSCPSACAQTIEDGAAPLRRAAASRATPRARDRRPAAAQARGARSAGARRRRRAGAASSSITDRAHLWPTSALIDWWSLLHRVAEASRPRRASPRSSRSCARASTSAAPRLGFSTEDGDELVWSDEPAAT